MQVEKEEKALAYKPEEAKVLGNFITHYASCYTQMYLLKKGLKKFKVEVVSAAKAELKQMHDCTCFRAMEVGELTRRERQRAMEALMLLTEKIREK